MRVRLGVRMQVLRADLAACGVLVLTALILFAPGVLEGKIPAFRDVLGFTLPSRALWRAALSEGHLPEWNAYVGIGSPVLASPVYGALYPPHLLLLFGPLPRMFTLLWATHALWAGFGGYGLARTLGCRPVAATSAGLFWLAGGYAVSMWGNGEKVLSGAWLPWIALAVILAMRTSMCSLATMAAATALACMALAGDPFLWFDALLFAMPLALGERPDIPARRVAWRALQIGVLAVGVGLLLCAPALIPALLLRGETSRRASLSRAAAELWSLHPVRWLELFVPGALGDPLDLANYPGAAFADDPTTQALPWAISLYAGVGVVLFTWFAKKERRTMLLATVAVVALALALGRHTPVHQIARILCPPLALERYPEKHVVVALAALVTLGSLGLERVLAGAVRLRWPLAACLAGPVLAIAGAPNALRNVVMARSAHAWVAGLAVIGVVWLSRRKPQCAVLIAAISAGDLASAAWPLLVWAEPDTVLPRGAIIPAILEHPTERPPRVFRPRGDDYLDPRTLPDNTGALFGIANIAGHDSTDYNGLSRLPAALGGTKLARLLAVDYLLLPAADAIPALPLHIAERGWVLQDLPNWPAAWQVGDIVEADSEESVRVLGQSSFDIERRAVVEPGINFGAVSPNREKRFGAPCAWVYHRPEDVELRCQAARDGLLLISQGYAPGWRATVDGESTPIVRADAVLSGIFVRAGVHSIRLGYSTPGLWAGLVGLLAGTLIAAVVGMVGWKRRRNRGRVTRDCERAERQHTAGPG